jgi:hypothetical protein
LIAGPGLLALYRDRSGSLSSDIRVLYEAERRVYEAVDGRRDVPADVRSAAEERVADCTVRLQGLHERTERGRTRTALSRAKQALLWRSTYYADPPAEIAEAFPELGRL